MKVRQAAFIYLELNRHKRYKDEQPSLPAKIDFLSYNTRNARRFIENRIKDEQLELQVYINICRNFKYPFEDVYKNKVMDCMDQNQELFIKLIEEEFYELVFNATMKEVYKRFNTDSVYS